MRSTVTVACVQAEPVVLDREATLDKLATLTAEAAGQGAELVVFPESSPRCTRAKAAFAQLVQQRFDPAGHYHRPDVLQLIVTPLT